MERQKNLALIIISIVIGLIISVAASYLPEYLILSILVLFLYGIILLIFHWLYNLLNWIDPTVMFVVSYVVFIGIGIVMTGYYGIELAPSVLIALVVGLTTFLIGALASDILFSPTGRIKIRRPVIVVSNLRRKEVTWAWVFFFIGVFVLLYYYYRVGTIPFLAENAEDVRIVVKSGQGYLPILSYTFLTVGLTILTAHGSVKKRSLGYIGVVVPILVGSLLLLGVGFRAPALYLILASFIVYAFIRDAKLFILRALLLGLLIVISIGLLGFYRLESSLTTDLLMILRLGLWRIFVNNLYVLNLVFAFFPSMESYMLGKSYLIDIITLLPGSQPHFGSWLKDRLSLEFAGGGVTQTVIGEFYLNWGWTGIVLGMFALGLTLRILYHVLTKRQSLPISRFVFMVLLSISLMKMVSSGIGLVLLFDTLPLMLVYAAYQLCVWLTGSTGQWKSTYVLKSVKS